MSHIAEVHIADDLEHFPDKVLVQASVMQSRLENAAATLAHLKNRLETTGPIPDTEGSEEDEYFEIFQSLDVLISSSRSAKVVSTKVIRQLEDLKSRSLTLDPSAINIVDQVQESALEYSSSNRSARCKRATLGLINPFILCFPAKPIFHLSMPSYNQPQQIYRPSII